MFCLLPKLQPANVVVERLLKHMVSQEPGYQYFMAEPGMVGGLSGVEGTSVFSELNPQE